MHANSASLIGMEFAQQRVYKSNDISFISTNRIAWPAASRSKNIRSLSLIAPPFDLNYISTLGLSRNQSSISRDDIHPCQLLLSLRSSARPLPLDGSWGQVSLCAVIPGSHDSLRKLLQPAQYSISQPSSDLRCVRIPYWGECQCLGLFRQRARER